MQTKAAEMAAATAAADRAVSAAAAAVAAATESVAAAAEAAVGVAEAAVAATGPANAAAVAATGSPVAGAAAAVAGSTGGDAAAADTAAGHGARPAARSTAARPGGRRGRLKKLLLPRRERPARPAGAWPLLGLAVVAVAALALPSTLDVPGASAAAPPEIPGASAAAGALAGGGTPPPAPQCSPHPSLHDLGPKLNAEMDARIGALLGEIDGIRAEYGFLYEEADLTDEQYARMAEELDAAAAEYAPLLDEIASLRSARNAFAPSAAEEAVYTLIQGAMHETLREYGYVIEEPVLSAEDEERLHERVDAVWDKVDAVHEEYYLLAERQAAAAGCPPPPDDSPHPGDLYGALSEAEVAEMEARIAALYEEYNAILAEHGIMPMPGPLAADEQAALDAKMSELDERYMAAYQGLTVRLAGMFASGNISAAQALDEEGRLEAQYDAMYREVMAEYMPAAAAASEGGLEVPANGGAALAERLVAVLERIEAVHEEYLGDLDTDAIVPPAGPALLG